MGKENDKNSQLFFSSSRFIDDRTKTKVQDIDEHKQASEFRWPRDTLLSVISTFVHFSTQRLKELVKGINDPTIRLPELLDAKSHTRLADIAHTLLKLGGYDPMTMSCRGIQNYFQKLLPCTNWSQEQLRPALNLLLRRIDRMFSKICKKPMTKVKTKTERKFSRRFFLSALFRLGSDGRNFKRNLFDDRSSSVHRLFSQSQSVSFGLYRLGFE